jgi:hypothetical protein
MPIEIAAAKQLGSGDVDLYLKSTRDREELLRLSSSWLKCLGQGATIATASYGVTMHGIRTASMEMSPQGVLRTIQQLKQANAHQLPPEATIIHVSWLKRVNAQKPRTSVVVEFGHPEDANTAIDNGLVWEGEPKTCEVYDKTVRVIRCHHCQKFGHLGTQCRAPIKCGTCAGEHSTQSCPTPNRKRCANCGGPHSASSATCSIALRKRTELDERRRLPRYGVPYPRSSQRTAGPNFQNVGAGFDPENQLARALQPREFDPRATNTTNRPIPALNDAPAHLPPGSPALAPLEDTTMDRALEPIRRSATPARSLWSTLLPLPQPLPSYTPPSPGPTIPSLSSGQLELTVADPETREGIAIIQQKPKLRIRRQAGDCSVQTPLEAQITRAHTRPAPAPPAQDPRGNTFIPPYAEKLRRLQPTPRIKRPDTRNLY